MREVKFRGKRKDNGEWVYGYYLVEEAYNRHIITYESFAETENGPEPAYCSREVIPETVGQFTGKRDNNKKDIFEHDILSFDRFKALVVFVDGCFSLKWLDKEDSNNLEPFSHYFFQYLEIGKGITGEGIKVIGNKFDNPELLRGDN